MINLEQIQKLEARVNKAVELIRSLKTENQNLRRTLDSAQSRMQELEQLVGEFKNDQKDIEQSILRALENLNELEDEIKEPQSAASAKKSRGAAEEEAEDNMPFEAKESKDETEGDGSGELDIF